MDDRNDWPKLNILEWFVLTVIAISLTGLIILILTYLNQ